MYCGFLINSKYYKAYCVAHLLFGNFTQIDDNICPQLESFADPIKFNATCNDALTNYQYMGSYNFQEITPKYYTYLKENNKLYEKGSNEFTARETFTSIEPTIVPTTIITSELYDMTRTVFQTLSSETVVTYVGEFTSTKNITTTITIPIFPTTTKLNGTETKTLTFTTTTVKTTLWPITTTIKSEYTSKFFIYTTTSVSTEVIPTSNVFSFETSYTKVVPFNAYSLQTDI
ncbi:hypothetical protein HDU92_005148 [Lobulomyces angularis]|nr:hypothetical protein HDU92_005148 [Lobulomyces angularis]